LKKIPGNIIISRTDSIGDVILTLPVAAILKKYFPQMKIGFMGKAYTRPVIEACPNVDSFIDVNDFLVKKISVCGEKPEAILHVLPVAKIATRARRLKIPLRIGTNSRIFHWITCNQLVKLSRRKSSLHEAQLNLKLLQAFGLTQEFTLDELGRCLYLTRIQPLHKKFVSLLDNEKYNLILHPKSQGNGREWGLDNFIQLIRLLDKNKFKIFISGVEKEKALLQPLFDVTQGMATDITGIMNLVEFMSFIAACNGLVASGTGPIHLAAATGIDAFGIYPPIRPMNPERWSPLGRRVCVFVLSKVCNLCKGNKIACTCMMDVKPFWIKEALDKAFVAYKNSSGDVVVSA
jgi:heptosyltransferase III